jgi:hypothetical protein
MVFDDCLGTHTIQKAGTRIAYLPEHDTHQTKTNKQLHQSTTDLDLLKHMRPMTGV